jgi:hypothetical protein
LKPVLPSGCSTRHLGTDTARASETIETRQITLDLIMASPESSVTQVEMATLVRG